MLNPSTEEYDCGEKFSNQQIALAKRGDSIELVEWGNYDFAGNGTGTRPPAGRICSYHYQGYPKQSYVEVGGMRFVEWDRASRNRIRGGRRRLLMRSSSASAALEQSAGFERLMKRPRAEL